MMNRFHTPIGRLLAVSYTFITLTLHHQTALTNDAFVPIDTDTLERISGDTLMWICYVALPGLLLAYLTRLIIATARVSKK